MFKFNWQTVISKSNYNPFKSIEFLRELYYNKPVDQHKFKNLRGSSFLLNPRDILEDNSTDPIYVYQYITLAARRDYLFYKQYGIKYLPLAYYPDINLGSIKHNPLLHVTNNEIYFKYEEKHGTSIWRN